VQALAGDRLSVFAGRYPQDSVTGMLARFRDDHFGTVGGVAFDAAANQIFITETSANQIHAIQIVDPVDVTTWTITPLVTGGSGFADGAAVSAQFRTPTGLYFDATTRQLYIADTGNHAIRVLDVGTGIVSTVIGVPQTRGFLGDGGPPASALLFAPELVARCGNGDLFVADTGNNRVRRIANGVISTVLGDGSPSSSGEGRPASTFPVDTPRGLACDDVGNLFVTSRTVIRMVMSDATGVVDGTGRVRTIYGRDRDVFPASVTACLSGLGVDDTNTISVTDSCTGIMLQLHRAATP
jgi:sugar lactone lactonase YvrE